MLQEILRVTRGIEAVFHTAFVIHSLGPHDLLNLLQGVVVTTRTDCVLSTRFRIRHDTVSYPLRNHFAIAGRPKVLQSYHRTALRPLAFSSSFVDSSARDRIGAAPPRP